MKKNLSFLLGCLFISTCSSVLAQTHYVTENLHTYMRRGAGDQFKISGTIQAGERVAVLDRKERYVLIRDAKNREGWILAS